jgi:hypothetical protein
LHLSYLGVSQQIRFNWLGDLSDLENSITNGPEAVNLTNDAHQIKALLLSNLGVSQ